MAGLRTTRRRPVGAVAFGVDVAPWQASASIVACGDNGDGTPVWSWWSVAPARNGYRPGWPSWCATEVSAIGSIRKAPSGRCSPTWNVQACRWCPSTAKTRRGVDVAVGRGRRTPSCAPRPTGTAAAVSGARRRQNRGRAALVPFRFDCRHFPAGSGHSGALAVAVPRRGVHHTDIYFV